MCRDMDQIMDGAKKSWVVICLEFCLSYCTIESTSSVIDVVIWILKELPLKKTCELHPRFLDKGYYWELFSALRHYSNFQRYSLSRTHKICSRSMHVTNTLVYSSYPFNPALFVFELEGGHSSMKSNLYKLSDCRPYVLPRQFFSCPPHKDSESNGEGKNYDEHLACGTASISPFCLLDNVVGFYIDHQVMHINEEPRSAIFIL